MKIARAPFRLSLFGGGSDYRSYYEEFGSTIIGFTIDKYAYIACRYTPDIFDYKTRVQYSKVEEVQCNKEIEHNGIRGVLEFLRDTNGYEISHMGDLPARTGVGSSSSCVVALLHLLKYHAYKGEITAEQNVEYIKRTVAQEAIAIERDLLDEAGGVQDQIWASYGGCNRIQLHKGGGFTVTPFKLDRAELLSRCVLLYTGKARYSYKIAQSYENKDSLTNKHKIVEIARVAEDALGHGDFDEVGKLLDHSWKQKRKISPHVSNEHVDIMYDRGLGNGAIGGKLLGSGGSGFLFFILEEGVDRKEFAENMCLRKIDFSIDDEGAKIVL